AVWFAAGVIDHDRVGVFPLAGTGEREQVIAAISGEQKREGLGRDRIRVHAARFILLARRAAVDLDQIPDDVRAAIAVSALRLDMQIGLRRPRHSLGSEVPPDTDYRLLFFENDALPTLV